MKPSNRSGSAASGLTAQRESDCLHAWIQAQVKRAPNAVAVRCDGRDTTFAELNRRANQLAHFLRALGVGPDKIVAVLMERSLEMSVALLGILKAGAAYLPLDPAYPDARRNLLLEDAGVSVVLTQERFEAFDFDGTVLALDREWAYIAREPDHNPTVPVDDHHLAYVIYTSGSTGKPKGCMIPHRAICNRLLWMQRCYRIGRTDRILQKTPYTFDVSVWELFLPLLSGACLVYAKPDGHKDAAYLVHLIQQEKITVCHFVPSMLRFFLSHTKVQQCHSLRHVFASGEALGLDLVTQYLQKCPGKLHNLYGPTEAAVDVSYWECALRTDGKVPIGRPIDGIELLVLDSEFARVPDGEPGELLIGGIGLARGYLNRPALTAERFIQHPYNEDPEARLYRTGDLAAVLSDGNIEYLGRMDDQVKLRGFRIELGEIDWVLRQHESVADAAVNVVDRDSADPKLVAYVVPVGDGVDARGLRDALKQQLPRYMVPNHVVAIPELPLSRHGKLNRKALPWPVDEAVAATTEPRPEPAPQSPAAELQVRLAQVRAVCLPLLNRDDVADDADFFELGATSLTMVLMVEQLQERHGVTVPVEVMMDGPTVGELAAYLVGNAAPVALPDKVPADVCAQPRQALNLDPVSTQTDALPIGNGFGSGPVSRTQVDQLLATLARVPVDGEAKTLYASAGGLHPIQTYLAVREGGVSGLDAGVYYFDPAERFLRPLADTAPLLGELFHAADLARAEQAAFAVLFAAEMDAVQPVYKGSAAMLTAVECGYLSQTLLSRQAQWNLALAPALGLETAAWVKACALSDSHQCLLALLGGVAHHKTGSFDLTGYVAGNERRRRETESFLNRDRADTAFPSAEAKEQLLAKAAHLRRFPVGTPHLPVTAAPPVREVLAARSAKRTYRTAPVTAGQLTGLLGRIGSSKRYRFLPAGDLRAYVAVVADGVDGVGAGLYRYHENHHSLERLTDRMGHELKRCYTPFNRKHAGAAKFHLFLVARLGEGGRDEFAALLEAGHLGQALLEAQNELGLGLCPIGGLLFDKIRADFQLEPGDTLIHSFVGGGYEAIPPRRVTGEQQQPASEAAQQHRDIAVIGLAGRYPGADDTATFAANLRAGKTCFSERRFSDSVDYGSAGEGPHRHFGGFLSEIDRFDARLFKILPVEAKGIDPQERLLLESVWTCLEHAGYSGSELNRVAERVGVFTGVMWNDYGLHAADGWRDGRFPAVAMPSSLANRISHVFGFEGPSVSLNTSCSAGMTALHHACAALRAGQCGAAVVAGVNLMSHPSHLDLLKSLDFLSDSETCRPFGAQADGWVAGEGVGALLLKPLPDAERDRDALLAVVKGTSIGYSGKEGRFGAPSHARQRASMLAALRDARLDADAIDYVEAAAPGAGMADALEAAALKDVFGGKTDTTWVGSIKGGIGHLESASALSQLTKVVLQMQAGALFPTVGAEPLNPMVSFDEHGLALVTSPRPFPKLVRPFRALINAFGATGSSGHAVLEQVVQPSPVVENPGEQLLVLSAVCRAGLQQRAADLAAHLRANPLPLDAVAHTLRVGRVALPERLALVSGSLEHLLAQLDGFVAGDDPEDGVFVGLVEREGAVLAQALPLDALARHWVAGDRIDWAAAVEGPKPRRVHLPTFAFARQSYWLDAASVSQPPVASVTPAEAPTEPAKPDQPALAQYLKQLFASVTELPLQEIKNHTTFDHYGINSLIIARFNAVLARDFVDLPKTLFFEVQTLAALVDYLVKHHAEAVNRLFPGAPQTELPRAEPTSVPRVVVSSPAKRAPAVEDIAVIGVAGRYPKAENLDIFWENLKNGLDCVGEVPADRWDLNRYYTDGPARLGTMTTKWGGFLEDVACFDPLFFQISPAEAKAMDPQERLFLQTVHHTFENAGYNREALRHCFTNRVGVFVGVMYGEYQLFGGGANPVVSTCYGSIANRVSFIYDLSGPSMAVDTLCSSSLTALHLAVQSLQRGECAAAVVGGVNLSLHPNKYMVQSQLGMAAADGRCRSFGAGGDGLVPGEGVGAVLLKPLTEARADGDQILGVVKATAVNHDGKTHGYTVPNPNAQAALIAQALRVGGVDPAMVGYVEAHGTGTPLGDPIEIAGLTKALGDKAGRCAVGSVKSNLGHLEAAAGIVGLTKILLQLKHGWLAPSLHAETLNENIDFSSGPFRVQREGAAWKRPVLEKQGEGPRVACLSSFGAGGANAHAVIYEDEPRPVRQVLSTETGPWPILFSAVDGERLRTLVFQFHTWFQGLGDETPRLDDIAYTLQVGRDALEQRLALVVRSPEELLDKTAAFLDDPNRADYSGTVNRDHDLFELFADEAALQTSVQTWLEQHRLDPLLRLWVQGLAVDWRLFYGTEPPRRVALPVYPFRREHCWLFDNTVATTSGRLHPLVHRNTSHFHAQCFQSELDPAQLPWLGDGGRPMLGWLEAARFAVSHTLALQGEAVDGLLLSALEAVSLPAEHGALLSVAIDLVPDESSVFWSISIDAANGDTQLVAEGRGDVVEADTAAPLQTPETRARAAWVAADDPESCVRAVAQVDGHTWLDLAPRPTQEEAECWLPPTLLQALLNAADAVDVLQVTVWADCRSARWCRVHGETETTDRRLDLCDADGKCLATITATARNATRVSLCKPEWQAAPMDEPVTPATYSRRIVVLCDLDRAVVKTANAALAEWDVVVLKTTETTLSERYQDMTCQIFSLLKAWADGEGRSLCQFLIGAEPRHHIYRGLVGMLRTARMEQPSLTLQLLEIEKTAVNEHLSACLDAGAGTPEDVHVRFQAGRRWVPDWTVVDAAPQQLWRADGVYLVTGGLGGLGWLFAREIAATAPGATLVLTGRSPLDTAKQQKLDTLAALGGVVWYREVDVCHREAVDALVREIRSAFGGVHGVFHVAGLNRDNLIARKTLGEVKTVLAPKVLGTVVLDLATRDLALDFMMLCGSSVGVFGNVAQTDYAAANGFMHAFAAVRNQQVSEGLRTGRTLTLNWPLWRDGGMQVDTRVLADMERAGWAPLPSADGLQALRRAFGVTDADSIAVLCQTEAAPAEAEAKPAGSPQPQAASPLARLIAVFAEVAGLAEDRIDAEASLERYGIDSIMVTQLNQKLDPIFPDLSKTLFYEHQTLAACADHLARRHPRETERWCGAVPTTGAVPSLSAAGRPPKPRRGKKIERRVTSVDRQVGTQMPIAVIGLHGRFPKAPDLETFWDNLRSGRDCISEIPPERWSLDGFFLQPVKEAVAQGKSYAKWGGFLEGFADFDPLFFNISPFEALNTDPQERLFLESCWAALEDAGITRAALKQDYDGAVGVFAGITQTGFNLVGAELKAQGENCHFHTSFSSVANRVSYVLDIHGPSLPVDTMCSSSLTAIHEACERLRSGECRLALAGGVNLYLHPSQYVAMSSATMLSADGRCHSFGAGGNGYVPGEGVGSVVLKPLADALRDRDPIHAVIRGGSINHGGKTHGYTVPNPVAQSALIRDAFAKAGVDARAVGYIEAHGTGTKLGDPIEVTGLTDAFRADTDATGFCALGSAKSNIGHLEAAAGIAGLAKIILQMKHATLVPTLHVAEPNPNIDFAKTPFVLQQNAAPWPQPQWQEKGRTQSGPRLAGISSFGAGGANAHLVVEEAPAASASAVVEAPVLIVLSALNEAALARMEANLSAFLQREQPNLRDLAFTLQVGREPMPCRLAVVAASVAELQAALAEDVGLMRGLVSDVQPLVTTTDLTALAEAWVAGAEVAWETLYSGTSPRRIHLPTYPFAGQTLWLQPKPAAAAPAPVAPKPQEETAAEWLYHEEVWLPRPLPDAVDWAAGLSRFHGRRLAVVYSEPAEKELFLALLGQIKQAAGVSLEIQTLAAEQLETATLDAAPAVVLVLGSAGDGSAFNERDPRTVFQLCHRLMNQFWGETIDLWFVYQITPQRPRLDCQALGGLVRSAMQENPNHRWHLIAGENDRVDPLQKHQVLLTEWLARPEPGENPLAQREVRYRDGLRCEKAWAEVAPPSTVSTVFKQCGTYLLAGGLGYIGRLLAMNLAARYAATLVILSRRERNAEVTSFLADLERAGATVHYVRVDITDGDALRAAYARIRAEVGPLHGVVNLARSHEDRMIAGKSWASFARVIQTKVQATLLLDQLSAEEPLDFFLLFSSLGSLGVRGSSDYGYATAYQNAFAHYRRELGRPGVALAQCWSAWEEDSLFPETRRQLQHMGFHLINMVRAFPEIDRSLSMGYPVLTMMQVHDADKVRQALGLVEEASENPVSTQQLATWERRQASGEDVSALVAAVVTPALAESLPPAYIQRLHALLYPPAPAEPVAVPAAPSPVRRDDDLPQLVRSLLTEVLRLPAIEDDKPLQDYGLDSISAMHFSTRMEKVIHREVQPQWLLDYPTVTALTRHLAHLTASKQD